jgi:hypothetical protein
VQTTPENTVPCNDDDHDDDDDDDHDNDNDDDKDDIYIAIGSQKMTGLYVLIH